jgi:hypothetical protein
MLGTMVVVVAAASLPAAPPAAPPAEPAAEPAAAAPANAAGAAATPAAPATSPQPASAALPGNVPPGDAGAATPRPLNKQGTVLIDPARRRLILKTEVVLRAGLLEMLLCKSRTKEHESILAVKSDAFVIHGGLLALGAEPGTPVRYEPEFRPPTGQKIEIVLRWRDAAGQPQSAPAQSWIRHAVHRYYAYPLAQLPAGFELPKESELRYDPASKELLWFGPMTAVQKDHLLGLSQDAEYRKAIGRFFEQSQSRQLEADWVFAGSGFYEQGDGSKYYQAEDGNVICVANFGDAMLDLSIASSASNEGLQFEPWTERIPPLGTPVDVELIVAPAEAEARTGESKSP